MATGALGAADLPRSQPLAKPGIALVSARRQSLLRAGDSRIADQILYYLMLACGASILALVVLLVYELITKSSLSWHGFGFKFFCVSDWEPLSRKDGAM